MDFVGQSAPQRRPCGIPAACSVQNTDRYVPGLRAVLPEYLLALSIRVRHYDEAYQLDRREGASTHAVTSSRRGTIKALASLDRTPSVAQESIRHPEQLACATAVQVTLRSVLSVANAYFALCIYSLLLARRSLNEPDG